MTIRIQSHTIPCTYLLKGVRGSAGTDLPHTHKHNDNHFQELLVGTTLSSSFRSPFCSSLLLHLPPHSLIPFYTLSLSSLLSFHPTSLPPTFPLTLLPSLPPSHSPTLPPTPFVPPSHPPSPGLLCLLHQCVDKTSLRHKSFVVLCYPLLCQDGRERFARVH